VRDTDDMTQQSVRIGVQKEWLKAGDRVVISAGVPLEVPGTTNLMQVYDIPG
jgi:pyruvate kinase